MLEESLRRVRNRIASAALRSFRKPQDITLVCVTKTVDIPQIEEVISYGVTDIGENRVQDALRKHERIGGKVKWHMVGHLQKNKVKHAVKIFDLIHSLDSIELANEIDKCALNTGKIMDALVEVKTSDEPSKFGVAIDSVYELAKRVSLLEHVRVRGLMTMAPVVDNPEKARAYFRKLKQTADEIAAMKISHISMDYLSMGMTQDFEVAIEEGANIVRIGNAIFAGQA
jgi:pyridoxal phosphate enzyme (YggS family)